MKQIMDLPSCKWNLLRVFVLICTTLASTLSFGQAGNAPMQSLPNFTGPMAIDGFITRQGVNGDWLPGPGGATNTVFNNSCVPLVPLAFRLTDLFDDLVNDDIFDGGNKLNDNPNDWGWRSQKPPAKDDINTSMVFIALNPADNHIWLAISGDRMSTNGTSYIDFEFYQNTITKTDGETPPGPPVLGSTGGFLSTGPHNGRTVGDISITLEFTNGGSFATVKYQQWQPGSEAGSYDYFDVTPAAGTAFAAANQGVIAVPCGAFGQNTYAELQFVEGAIDLTALIGGTGLPGECGGLPFKTLFIKTKSSAEKTADLKDFISPFQINVCFDRTAPVINCPNTLNLGCNPSIPPPSGATASDNCAGPVIPVAADGPVQSSGCNRSMIRTWRAQDDCGNTASCGQTINWTADLASPVFTGSYADVNLGCNPANPDGSLGSAGASDACGALTITQSDGAVVSDGCNRSRTRTFTARDACTNTSSTSRTVRWIADPTPPVITGSYADVNLGCNPANPDGSLGSASATDGCSAVTITQSDGAVASDGCNRSRTRTFTARDGCNNTATVSRTVRWIADNTPPTFTGSYADVNLGCNPANPDGSLGSASATDACGAVTITQSDGAVLSDGCNRSRTRTFTATDGCLNTSTISRTVRWIADNVPPAFSGNFADVNLGCNPANPDGSLGGASATDACGAVTISQSDGAVVSDGCNRARTRTFTARDGCNNTSTTSRTVRWIADLTPPSFTGSYADVNLGCNPADPAGSLGTATATDACGPVTITSSDGGVLSDGCLRSQTRTFTARDGCNNTSTTSRTVRWTSDLTPPAFTSLTTPINLGCQSAGADPFGAIGGATATDACSVPTITFSDGSIQSDGCARSATRTFTARDACGNTATASRSVTFIFDPNPPVFTGSYADVNLGCNPANPDGSLGSASATDACGAVTITQSDGAVVSDGCSRARTRTFTARDACDNTATTSRTVRWIADVTPPAFTGSYADVNLGCNPANPDGSLGSASATDACGAVTITQSDGAVVSDGCNRARTRTFTARDGCNNTSTTSRTVRWIADVTPPAFTGSYGDVNLGCNPANPDGSLGSASATDACGAVTITQSDAAVVSDGCNRARTRTFTARDGCNNTSTTSRTVRWIADVTPPAFTGSYGDVNLGCNPANPDGSLGSASATDACGAVTITQSDGSVVSDGCNRSRTRTFTARDGCSNTSTISRTVRWVADLTAPVFVTTPASVDVACDAPIPTAATPTASDACGTPTVTQTGTTDNATDCGTGFQRVVTRTWRAQDACGNTATYTQTIRVECCPSAFCTYTQGAYGSEGGTMCDGENGGWTTLQFINNSLANWGGSFTVGKPGHSVLVNNAQCVMNELPGSSAPKELPGGDFGICALPASLQNGQGRIKNILLAQTITLGLNLGIENTQLGGFVLQAGELATQDPAGGCGDETPETRVCHYNTLAPFNLISVENEYTYRTFTQAVIDAIPGANTVANLFELANRALANVDGVVGSEGGATLDEINEAVSSVNEVFDECKIFIGWNVSRCPPIDPTPGDGRIAPTTVSPTLEVTAYPNPYQENFSLRVKSPVSGQASIGFYTIDGVKIGEMKRDVVAKREVWVPFNVPAVYRTRIVYTVNVGSYNAKGVVLSPN